MTAADRPNETAPKPIAPTTVLKRAAEVTIQLRSDNQVEMAAGPMRAVTGLHGLAILEAFSKATSYSAAIQKLAARASGAADFIELTSTIVGLVRNGILVDQSAVRPTVAHAQSQFDSAWIHIDMLNDRGRTESYLRAIRDVVRPGDVVVDVGTGTGVLAIAAAQAGARHVYAIEVSSIGLVASKLFGVNGVADRVTLVEGHSTRVSLPEPADVLVSEIIGSDPLGEHVLEVTRDAAVRFLKPDARFVPATLTVYGYPVEVAEDTLERVRFSPDAIANWRSWYGIDFAPLADMRTPAPYQIFVRPKKLADFPRLGDPVVLMECDFRRRDPPVVEETRGFGVSRDGRLDGVAVYFELSLSPSVRLSTDPAQVRPDNSWRHVVWLLPEPLVVHAGDRFDLTYRHAKGGNVVDVRPR